MTMKRILFPLTLLVASCHSSNSPKTTPSDAPRSESKVVSLADFDANAMMGATVSLSGFLFHRDGDYELCETLCESFPPQCCGASVGVTGLDSEDAGAHLDGQSDDGTISWSNDAVVCTGTVEGDALVSASIESSPAVGSSDPEPNPTAPRTRCDSDADCEDGQTCQLVAACDTCDGGTMQCVE